MANTARLSIRIKQEFKTRNKYHISYDTKILHQCYYDVWYIFCYPVTFVICVATSKYQQGLRLQFPWYNRISDPVCCDHVGEAWGDEGRRGEWREQNVCKSLPSMFTWWYCHMSIFSVPDNIVLRRFTKNRPADNRPEDWDITRSVCVWAPHSTLGHTAQSYI